MRQLMRAIDFLHRSTHLEFPVAAVEAESESFSPSAVCYITRRTSSFLFAKAVRLGKNLLLFNSNLLLPNRRRLLLDHNEVLLNRRRFVLGKNLLLFNNNFFLPNNRRLRLDYNELLFSKRRLLLGQTLW